MTHSRGFLFVAGLAVALLGWFVSSRSGPSTTEELEVEPIAAGRTTEARARRAIGSLAGSVTDGAGTALSGALVCAAHATSHALGRVDSVCARTGSDGRYVIAEIRAGAYDVSALLDGYMPSGIGKERDIVVQPGQARSGVDFVLHRGGARFAGTVIDATGGPIEGASLALWFGDPATRKAMVETNADGQFVAWITPGSVGVTATAPGYAQALSAHVAPSSDLVIRMTPGGAIQGTVVSVDRGAPVAGMEVRAVCHYCFGSAGSPAAISGADGRFEIGGLEPALYVLTAEGDGWRGQAPEVVPVGLAQTSTGVLVLVSPVVEVAGRVELVSGEPCTRGSVMLGPLEDVPSGNGVAPVPNLVAGIEESGAVRFRSAPKGTYRATVACEDHVQAAGPTAVPVGDVNVEGLLWRVKPGLQLTVHVVDALGKPRPNTYFSVQFPSRTEDPNDRASMTLLTDANGRHQLQRNLYPGTYTVAPYQAAGERVTAELREGDDRPVEVTLRLDGEGSIEVTVQTSDAKPIDSVRVIAMPTEPLPAQLPGEANKAPSPGAVAFRRLSAWQARSIGEGRYLLASLKPGSYEIEVDDGLNAPITRKLQVSTGLVRETIVLDRGREIRGRVVDADGQPQRDVWVSATCATDQGTEPETITGDLAVRVLRESKRVISDTRGEFTLTDISRAATACTVRAEEPGGSVGETKNVVPAGDVVVSMRALGALSGMARTTDGRAVREFVISVAGENESQTRSEMVSSADGTWKLARVPPGHLKVSAQALTGETAEQTVELAPGQSLSNVQLQFAAAEGPPPSLAN